jgi:hypothetical protein
LKSASQRSKLPLFRQFSWLKAGVLAASSSADMVKANPVRRIV